MNQTDNVCLQMAHDRLARAIRLHAAGCPRAARRMLTASNHFLEAASYDPVTAEPTNA